MKVTQQKDVLKDRRKVGYTALVVEGDNIGKYMYMHVDSVVWGGNYRTRKAARRACIETYGGW